MLTRGRKTSPEGEMVAFWDKQAPFYARRYAGKFNEGHSFRVRRQRVCELFDKPGGRVLDIGCGPGVMMEYLLGNGCEAYGVDISEQMIAQCRLEFEGIPAAHFSVGKIEALQFPDSYFDAVTCLGVVEYIRDDEIAVKEMARVISPGGTAIITLPNKLSPYRVWDRLVYRKCTAPVKKLIGRHTQSIWHKEYVPARYCDLLATQGFTVTDIVYYDFKIMVSPLDIFLRGLTAALSAKLEVLHRSGLGWLGTGFIVKAVKTEPS